MYPYVCICACMHVYINVYMHILMYICNCTYKETRRAIGSAKNSDRLCRTHDSLCILSLPHTLIYIHIYIYIQMYT